MTQPNFLLAWAAYPDHKRYRTLATLHHFIGGTLQQNIETPGFSPLGNTCAVRMSRALNYGAMPINAKITRRLKIPTMTGGDGKLYIYRVAALKLYLQEALGATPIKVFKDFDTAFHGTRGIVAFDIAGWQSSSGHIALWDGKQFREMEYDDYRRQRDDPATHGNEGTITGMTLWPC